MEHRFAPYRTVYVIETREAQGWDAGTVNQPNGFDSHEEAEAAIEALRALGGRWADSTYRVVATGRIAP